MTEEQYSVACERPHAAYFSMIPHILFDLDLSPHARDLYVYFFRVAGLNGQCIQSNSTIASKLGVCKKTVIKARKELRRPQPLIGNRPLILCNHKRRDDGGSGTWQVIVRDLMPYNIARYSTGTTIEIKESSTPVHNMHGGGARDARGGVHEMHTKKNTIEEETAEEAAAGTTQSEPIKINQDEVSRESEEPEPAAAAAHFVEAAPSADSEPMASDSSPPEPAAAVPIDDQKRDWLSANMLDLGCDERFAAEVLQFYPLDEIARALDYTRGREPDNPPGFLRKSLEEGFGPENGQLPEGWNDGS